jgi:ABC-type dipeptide/oligopeptide/nickel transport system permease subunit
MAKDKKTPSKPAAVIDNSRISPRQSELQRVVRVFFGRKIAVFGLVVIVILIFTAIFAPQLAPYDPNKMSLEEKLLQPTPRHLLGTDSLGRDTLSRVIYGTRPSLMVGIGAVGLAAIIGGGLGLITAYSGGAVYAIIMRFTDALMATPMILNALIITSVLGGGLKNVIIALSVGMMSGQCRMMCGQAMTIQQNDYILATRSMGASALRVMLRHILPNAFPPILVMITIGLGTTILAEAGLSFLGLGIAPPQPAWGGMVNDGYKYLLTNPVLSFAPGIAIGLVVFGFNMMGDGLRDSLDPRLRGLL